jgi:cytochrome c oxidase subunit II
VSPRGHLLVAATVWLVLSVVGIILVLGMQIIPLIASREAEIENSAFVLLTAASVPVLLLVVVGLAYAALRFRATDEMADGPPVHGHPGFQSVWLGLSLLLVLGLFAYGAIGLIDIRGAQTADFEVNVSGEQWKWHFEYPAAGVTSEELHVPIDQRVQLNITSTDVIHSFWVPALGIKQDAVPGHPTHVYMTVTDSGIYGGMCAELCGLGHTHMTTTVFASDRASLDAWLSQQPQGPPGHPGPSGPPK